VRHGLFNRAADVAQIVRQMVRVQSRLHGHYAATNIDSDSRRNDRALGRDNAPHGRADPPMHVRHRGDPFVDEGQLSDVQELLLSFVLQLHAFRPGFDWDAVFDFDEVVFRICHYSTSFNQDR